MCERARAARSGRTRVERTRWGRGVLVGLSLAGLAAVRTARAEDLRIVDVSIVDVASGRLVSNQTVDVAGDRILWRGPASGAPARAGVRVVNAADQYLVPGLWDMHVHAHREDRSDSFYPLFVAHGVLGIREMGSHLAELLASRARWRAELVAPRVLWGTPALDGTPQILRHGLGVQTAGGGRALVRLLADLGFDFVKVYDRLPRETYEAIVDEARVRGLPVVGHVPLSSSPARAATLGQRSIEHLTLVLETCIPGAIERANQNARGDSMELLTDGWLSSRLASFSAPACAVLFEEFRRQAVWQTPTLVQLRGFAGARELAGIDDPRLALMRPSVREEWRQFGRELSPEVATAAQAILEQHGRLVLAMSRADVGILAGTDASSEPFVFPGESLHTELELLAAAGLEPIAALRTATLNPRTYRRGGSPEEPIRAGEEADLLLLRGNPLKSISATREIAAVILRGRLFDRRALDELLRQGKERAEQAGPEH